MNTIKMRFENINPYIRYSHHCKVYSDAFKDDLIAYDYRILLVTKGKGFIRINNIDYPVSRGTLLLWQPGVPYHFCPDDNNDEILTLYAINFDMTNNYSVQNNNPIVPSLPNSFKDDKIIQCAIFEDILEFNDTIYLQNVSFLEEYFYNIDNNYMLRKNLSNLKIRGLLILLLNEIAKHILVDENSIKTIQKNNKRIDAMIMYIKEHYTENITNEQMGEIFHFHPSHINRLFLKYTNTTLHKYIIIYRLNIAINLILTTSDSISDIAKKVGFTDANYFSRCFKKYSGVNPSNYRYFTNKKNSDDSN